MDWKILSPSALDRDRAENIVRTVNSILQALITSERELEQKVVLVEAVDVEKRNGVANNREIPYGPRHRQRPPKDRIQRTRCQG